MNHLLNSFTYIDAILVDIPIFDKVTRGKIINSMDIFSRLQRSEFLADYLDEIWNSQTFQNTHFNWIQKSTELRKDISKIRDKLNK